MRIKVYHDVNGTVRITKTIEQGSDMGKESSIFSDLKAGSVAEIEINAEVQHRAYIKETPLTGYLSNVFEHSCLLFHNIFFVPSQLVFPQPDYILCAKE